MEDGFGLVEFAAECARVKIFDVISVGEFVKFALTAFDGVENGSEGERENNSNGRGANNRE